jgi:hypothetical protein
MPDWAFYTLFFSVVAFWIFNGILMFVAPAKYRRFLYWFGRSRSWSRPIDEQPQLGLGLELERRLAGLGLAGMGIYIAWSVIRNIALGERSTDVGRSVLSSPRGDSFSLINGVCLLFFGVFIVLRPQSIVEWSKRHQPVPSEIPETTLATWKVGARLLGAAFMLGGIYTLWIALK